VLTSSVSTPEALPAVWAARIFTTCPLLLRDVREYLGGDIHYFSNRRPQGQICAAIIGPSEMRNSTPRIFPNNWLTERTVSTPPTALSFTVGDITTSLAPAYAEAESKPYRRPPSAVF